MSAAASKPLRPPARDEHRKLPLAERLPADLTAVEAFRRLSGLRNVVFFDSATASSGLGRYSYVAADPFAWIERSRGDGQTLAAAEELWQRYRAEAVADLPPFQGGLAGLLGYELGSSLERVPPAAIDDLPTPPFAFGAYDVVLAFDHHARESWIVSQGFPELEPLARRERAAQRIAQFRAWLDRPAAKVATTKGATPFEMLAPQFDVGIAGVTSNFSADAYRALIRQAVGYIHAGDVFQVNLAQRLLTRATVGPVDLFLRLRSQNPAPYAGYFDLGGSQIVSASPECFLSIRGRQVESRPIKGTRARHGHALADLFAGDELRASEKDRAENVMIVDLMRNDLSRVCLADSVRVEQLCRLEHYAFVQHLVSIVRGELREHATPFDLIRASFPGGSITGAPKVRAMQIIAELEPTVRGPYCGSLGFVGFDGTADFSILIRTITASGGWLQFPAGGGIVAQSDPDDEYQETWHKARGLLRALR